MADVLNPAAPRRRGWRAFGPTGWAGVVIVTLMLVACLATLPYTLSRESEEITAEGVAPRGTPPRRFEAMNPEEALFPPSWWSVPEAAPDSDGSHVLGTDRLGRDLFLRCLAGGGLSLGIGVAAALVAVLIGTAYGTVSGYFGGRVDAAMMRIVDILFGLPNILLVVLLAVAVDGLLERGGFDLSTGMRQLVNVLTLLIAIGGVTWLTMARVIRGQVLSLKQQPFMEACRATGVSLPRQFFIHLLPNLLGPIIVYATLTVPNAILTESFLSFLGIGVKEPLPSWGNLAAAGLNELNIVRSRWWLLLWPCLFIGLTLLALNFVGEGLREALDPRRRAI
ncbi:MAG: ABC transporter permease [Planctomycetes bacterium]|nr:ABC transporter permease [Planctomycetota bacterium]